MTVISYRIKLIEPVLVSQLAGDPNSNVSADYLPGSALRAALLMRFAQSNNVSPRDVLTCDKTQENARRLFFGKYRFLNGYPLDRMNNRTLPKPLSWRQSKDEQNNAKNAEDVPIVDFAFCSHEVDAEDVNHKCNDDQIQYVRANGVFCRVVSDALVRLVTPDRQVMVHTQRALNNRDFGRARTDDGAVFRYEALASGQAFEAAIQCDDADASRILDLLSGEYVLGGARTAGYGHVQISDAKPQESSWREASGQIPDGKTDIVVTLTSEMLLRDQNGQHVVDQNEFVRRLQKNLAARNAEVMVKPGQAFTGVSVVGGFNRKWGMPLPQSPAFSMGSVFALSMTPSVSPDLLQQIEIEGIGERRIDGFGSLVFGWQQAEKLKIEKDPAKEKQTRNDIPRKTILGDKLSESPARLIAKRMLRAQIESRLTARAGEIRVHRPPKRSQLSRLRNIVMNVLNEPPPVKLPDGKEPVDRIGKYLEDVGKRSSTREQWEGARVEPKKDAERERLIDWLTKLHTAESANEEGWREGVGIAKPIKVQIGSDVESVLDAQMRREFALHLMAEVLKRAAKESGREKKTL